MKKLFSFVICSFFTINIFSATFFSGLSGGKLNFQGNSTEKSNYKPELRLEVFFAGQFNFSQNIWSHIEFSMGTDDLLENTIFNRTQSLFKLDELSVIFRSNIQSVSNYLSVFMGTYDPIGSDVFLRRYFACEPIASKITESYLGLGGSILYPHFGIGFADVLKLHNQPLAFGLYGYINKEDLEYYVFNTDLRFACSYRYFTGDFAFGIGAPLANKNLGEDVLVAIEKLYWHFGTTLLFGNNYTQSLFIQAGLYKATFKKEKTDIASTDIYFLFEPRFVSKDLHFNFSIYSLPQKTTQELLFIEDNDTLGLDFNLYADSVYLGSKSFTFGSHFSLSFTEKSYASLKNFNSLFADKMKMNLNITPYMTTKFLSGELHLQSKLKLMSFANENIPQFFSLDVGYRTSF